MKYLGNIWVMFIQKGCVDNFETSEMCLWEFGVMCTQWTPQHVHLIDGSKGSSARLCASVDPLSLKPTFLSILLSFYVVSVFPPVLPPLVEKVEVLICLPCSKRRLSLFNLWINTPTYLQHVLHIIQKLQTHQHHSELCFFRFPLSFSVHFLQSHLQLPIHFHYGWTSNWFLISNHSIYLFFSLCWVDLGLLVCNLPKLA